MHSMYSTEAQTIRYSVWGRGKYIYMYTQIHSYRLEQVPIQHTAPAPTTPFLLLRTRQRFATQLDASCDGRWAQSGRKSVCPYMLECARLSAHRTARDLRAMSAHTCEHTHTRTVEICSRNQLNRKSALMVGGCLCVSVDDSTVGRTTTVGRRGSYMSADNGCAVHRAQKIKQFPLLSPVHVEHYKYLALYTGTGRAHNICVKPAVNSLKSYVFNCIDV